MVGVQVLQLIVLVAGELGSVASAVCIFAHFVGDLGRAMAFIPRGGSSFASCGRRLKLRLRATGLYAGRWLSTHDDIN